MIVNINEIGSIDVDTGRITVSDPSYNADVWCQVKDIEVKPGEYTGWAHVTNDLGGWGKRVVSLQVIHENFINKDVLFFDDHLDDWQEIGRAGVDAGIISIFKSGDKKNYKDDDWLDFCSEIGRNLYAKMDNLIVSSSGIGDGYYPVYVYRKDNEVVSIVVDFLDHPWLNGQEEG